MTIKFFKILKNRKDLKKGFTVFEMVIVTVIVVILTAVVLAGFPELGTRLSIGRVAREIALTARSAQVYGLAVREFPVNDRVYPPYGVWMMPNDEGGNEMILFADFCDQGDPDSCRGNFQDLRGNNNGLYDEGSGCGTDSTECVERLYMPQEVLILDACVANLVEEFCYADGELEEIQILFERPNPEAIITKDRLEQRFNSARFVVAASRFPEKTKTVRVWLTGQISVSGTEGGDSDG